MALAVDVERAHHGEVEREQRQARSPDRSGIAVRDGVPLAWDIHGDGPVTVLLMPTWSIIHSRHWKLQIPFLARHFRVLVFDGRGCGRSGRPSGATAYADSEFAEDAVAVMDATGTETAVLVALSRGATWAVGAAAQHPERVLGIFALAPACDLGVSNPTREVHPWDERLETTSGWAKHNRHHWLTGGVEDFREFFFAQVFPESHSTKQIEDALTWSADIAPQTLVDTTAGMLGLEGARRQDLIASCERVSCPVAVVHGSDDGVRPPSVGERLAALTGGSFTLLDGAGHGPHTRHPVVVNTMIRDFVDRVAPHAPVRRTWTCATGRRARVLYLSSPIGLGHARRDVAIAAELRARRPDMEIDWLTQHPVTTVLESVGERLHPASRWLLNESEHIEDEADEHDLHAFRAIRRMDEVMVNNYMVFDEVVREQHYDLVVADEAWEVDHFLHENPERKRFGYAWMSDFVGWLPMPDGGEAEARLTSDHNAEMIEQRARFPRLRDRSVFVGNPEDVVGDSFGPGLPGIREWTQRNFDFAGYVTGFELPGAHEVAQLRAALGCRPEHKLCVVTVGGSGVGEHLLRRVLQAVPSARRLVPELRFLVVCGPRIDPAGLPRHDGVRLCGHLPRLHDHLAAADVAVVQGGLTTCMELAAARTPFIYVPLEHHFEQNFHVRHRLERYDAGRHLAYAEACDPMLLAEAIVKEIGVESHVRPVESDGAARAADLLADLL